MHEQDEVIVLICNEGFTLINYWVIISCKKNE